MTDGESSLQEAREQALVARARFRMALGEAADWFSPNRLKAEAAQAASHQIDEAKAALRRSVTDHPLISWSLLAVVATALTYALRRPAMALAQTGDRAARTLYKRFFGRK